MDEDSDEIFEPIEIKQKIKEFIAANGNKLRIPSELVNDAIRWRLNRNDCQNRGYVLDGYPKNFENADKVFVVTPKAPEKVKPKEGDEEEDAPPEDEGEAVVLKPTL